MSLDDATFDKVIEAIYEHGNVARALRECGLSNGSFYRRIDADAEFAERYARAKAIGCHVVADEMRNRMAEEPPMVATQFGEHVDAGWVQWKRNQNDTDKWLLAKLASKSYGDKVTLAGDADNPIALVDGSSLASRLLPELAAGGAPAAPSDPDET